MWIILYRLLLCWWIVSYGLDVFNYWWYDTPIAPGAAVSACVITSLTFLEMLLNSILRQHIRESDPNDGLD
jgi:hypothetical protein